MSEVTKNDVFSTFLIPHSAIVADPQAFTARLERELGLLRRDIMKEVVKERRNQGIFIPHEWEVDFGTDDNTSEGSSEAGRAGGEAVEGSGVGED